MARTRKVEEAVISAVFDHSWRDLAAILNDYRSRLEALEAPDVEE